MKNASPRPAIFLDRDGVLNLDKGYVYKPADLVLLPGVATGLKALQDKGYLLLVITNQSGVARGYFSLAEVELFHQKLAATVESTSGAIIDKFYICPHYPDGKVAPYNVDCACRKPGIALIEAAQKDFPIAMKQSFLIGDKPSDVDCGLKAGLKTIQVSGAQYGVNGKATAQVEDFKAAVDYILKS